MLGFPKRMLRSGSVRMRLKCTMWSTCHWSLPLYTSVTPPALKNMQCVVAASWFAAWMGCRRACTVLTGDSDNLGGDSATAR